MTDSDPDPAKSLVAAEEPLRRLLASNGYPANIRRVVAENVVLDKRGPLLDSRMIGILILAVVLHVSVAIARAQGFEDDQVTHDFHVPPHPVLDPSSANCKYDNGTLREATTVSRQVLSMRGYSAALLFHGVPDPSGEIPPYCNKKTTIWFSLRVKPRTSTCTIRSARNHTSCPNLQVCA